MTEVIIFEADEPDMIVLESREPQPVILESDGGSGNATCIYTTPVTGPATSAVRAPSDIIINDQPSLPAMDPTTYAISSPRTLTWEHILATVASGGFEGVAFDPRSPGTRVEYAHP